ncbi:hypothetical protein Pelo_14154 [Pelomyxa schiedti]|nr:hypothetical protein Pelo_14154 [Pelomyxa schiedti]
MTGSLVALRRYQELHWRIFFTCIGCQGLVALAIMCNFFVWTPETVHEESPLCTFLGFMENFFDIATILWIIVLASAIHRKVRLVKHRLLLGVEDKPQGCTRHEIIVNIAVWASSFIVASIPLWDSSNICYMRTDCGWCWISSDPWYSRLGNTIIEWTGIVAVIVLYTHVAILRRHQLPRIICPCKTRPLTDTDLENESKFLRQIILYPLVMIIVWLPSDITGLLQMFSVLGDFVPDVVVAATWPSGGMCLLLVYIGSQNFLSQAHATATVSASNDTDG